MDNNKGEIENMMNNNSVLTGRRSNLELLRICSMIFIVLAHVIVHGNLDKSNLIQNQIGIIGLQLGSRIGVNCFVLISGYFMVESRYKKEKLYSLLIQVFTYSFIITSILTILGIIPFSLKRTIYALLPTITSQYWFATSYILLYLLTPYLQILVKTMTKKQHLDLIVILLFVWSVLPTILLGSPGYSNLGWLICIWLIAAYIRLYYDSIVCVKIWHGILCLFSIIGITVLVYCIGKESNFIEQNAVYLFAEMNKIPAVICSILIFLGFKSFNIKSSNFINNISACTFGVYLFHDNPNIRYFLWESICQNNRYINSPWLIFRIIICTCLVFILGVLIEMSRQKIINYIKRRRNIYVKSKYNSSSL